MWNSDNVEISYNEITGYPGIAQGILLKEGSDDVHMLGNRIHDVGGEWPEHEHAIYCDSANRPIMANNLIYSSRAGYGIHLFGNCDNALVTNNTVTTSQTSGITIGGNSDRGTTDNALIQNNIVADNANGGNGSYGWGVTSYQGLGQRHPQQPVPQQLQGQRQLREVLGLGQQGRRPDVRQRGGARLPGEVGQPRALGRVRRRPEGRLRQGPPAAGLGPRDGRLPERQLGPRPGAAARAGAPARAGSRSRSRSPRRSRRAAAAA